jgi:hypothetical protein
MVIYEWEDVKYLGKVTDPDDYLPVSRSPHSFYFPFIFGDFISQQKTYVCTASAVTQGFCTQDQLGRFILDLPEGKSVNDTSFWSARLQLPASNATSSSEGFWNNPAGNPTPPPSKYTSPWRHRDRGALSPRLSSVPRQSTDFSPSGLHLYTEPIQYPVRKTGYYCVGEWFSST